MLATASGCSVPATCTNTVRAAPLWRVSTISSRSLATASSSSRSSTTESREGSTATPSSWVRMLSACAARRMIAEIAEPSATRSSRSRSVTAAATGGNCISESTYTR